MTKQKDIISDLYRSTFFIFLLSMLASSIGNVIDGVIIGNLLGADSMAAFGFTTPYQKFTAIFPFVITLGMQILCSQKLGKGKLNEANGVFSLALSFTILLMLLFTAATFLFPAQIADLLDAKEDFGIVRTEAINYFQAFSLGLPAVATVAILTPIMQLDSDRQRAVTAVTILSASNVLGDLIAIFYFGGTMWSIGIATAASYYLSAAFLILHFFKPESNMTFSAADIKISNLREMFLIGSPVMLGRGASMVQSVFLNYVAAGIGGGAGVAVIAIFNNLLSMLEAFPKALSSAMQMIAGIFIGEQDRKSILRLIKVAVKYSLIISLSTAGILILAAPVIAELYVPDKNSAVYFMVIEGIYWLAGGLLFITLQAILQYFYQAYGRFNLVNFLALADNILFVVPIVLISTPYFGMSGIFMTALLNSLLTLSVTFLGVWIYWKKITFNLEDILLLPKDFDAAENPQINITVTSKAEVLKLAEQVQYFCRSHNLNKRKGMFAAISVEEMAKNIIEHGFNDGKLHSIDIRVIIYGENVILRIRDDCRAFNPKKWQEIYNSENPEAHIGIRLVSQIATEFNYVNILKLNNLIIKI